MTERPIVLFAAMPQEIEAYKQAFEGPTTEEHTGLLEITRGTIKEQPVILAQTGICKTNAASATQHLIDLYNPEAIIMSGTAGGLQERLDHGDVLVIDKAANHDITVPIPVYQEKRGEVPDFRAPGDERPRELWYASDRKLKSLAEVAGEAIPTEYVVHLGSIITGEFFATDDDKRELLEVEHFKDVDAIDMEYAAVAQTVHRNNLRRNASDRIAVLGVKGIPDTIYSPAEADFDKYLGIASENSAKVALGVVDKIATEKQVFRSRAARV